MSTHETPILCRSEPLSSRAPSVLALAAWLALLAVILLRPFPADSPAPGDDLIRNTIRLALAYWFLAANLLLVLQPADWPAATPRSSLARTCWTLAWAAYVVHVGMAFHYYHGWSHADAVRHTEEVSGFGPGIYVSHLFTLLWGADVLFWWLRPKRYAARSPWIDRVLHGFLVFVIFNGTVVYESGPIRWVGAAAFVELAVMFFRRLRRAPAPS